MNQLPVGRGTHRYVSRRRDGLPVRRAGGYVDAADRVWEWSPGLFPGRANSCDHWDVQFPDGDYRNVAPDGEIHHGEDC